MKVKTVKKICWSIMAGVVILSNAGAMLTFANNHWDYYDLKPGTYKYLRNSVYEKGYRYAYLVFTEAHHKTGWIRGLWSPDSI